MLLNLLPNGRSLKVYGTTISKFGRRPFLEDWATLFRLLEQDHIHPIIYKQFPLLEAAQANALLESGQVVGNVVLVAPELDDHVPTSETSFAFRGATSTL